MVSFVCNSCQETIKKPKLDQHRGRCRGAYFSCIDCYTDFKGTEYRSHTSCISEAQKVQGSLFKGNKKNQQNNNNNNRNNNSFNNNSNNNKINFNDDKVEAPKPVSIMEELKTKEDNKRKEVESSEAEESSSKKTKTEAKELTKWDKKELPSDIKLTIQLGIKKVLEKNDNKLSYKKLLKKLVKLVEDHPKKDQFKTKDIEASFSEMINFKLDSDKIEVNFN